MEPQRAGCPLDSARFLSRARSKIAEGGPRHTLVELFNPRRRSRGASPAPGGLFRKYVAMVVGVVVLALTVNGASDLLISYREQKALLFRLQQAQARAAADKISNFLTEITAGLAWEAQLSWDDNTADEWRFDAVRLFRQVPAITEVAQIDPSGREQFRFSRQEPDVVRSGIDHSHSGAFTQALTHKIYYGPVYFVAESQPSMTIAVAGARAENGVVAAQVNLTFIWDVVSQIRVGKRGQAYVVDEVGRLIASPDISEVLRKTDLSRLAQVREAQTNGIPDQPLEGVNSAGGRVLSAYAAVAPPGWLVFTDLPIEEAYASLYDSALRSLGVVFIALVLAILVGLFLARRMVIPIRALHDGAARIGAGDLSQRIPTKTGDELEALGEQFNRMAERLQDSHATLERKVEERTRQLEIANQAKSRFLATASHDLRQPLHALGLFVAQLRGRTRADDRRRIVAGIDAAMSGMSELFNALLDISKLDAGALAPKFEQFPIERLLDRIETGFAGTAREKGLSLRIIRNETWVRSDVILLERILSNLVSNAIRYTEHGRVLVGCRRKGDRLRIEIWDTGSGIPEDQRRHIFSEFYRLEEHNGDHRGLGLGLAIVDRLSRLLQHPIELSSALNKGSCFCVTVPALQTSSKAARSKMAPAALSPRLGDKVVVIIDDDPLVLDGMGGLIRSWGCKVLTGNDDSDVWRQLAAYGDPPNLIISDYQLRTGKTGIEAIAYLRAKWTAPVPAFLMTGDVMLNETSANGYALLHKPIDPAKLRLALASALIESPAAAALHHDV
jgi:signal transduction histidine kinase/CheY-like chemotaxis protein